MKRGQELLSHLPSTFRGGGRGRKEAPFPEVMAQEIMNCVFNPILPVLPLMEMDPRF